MINDEQPLSRKERDISKFLSKKKDFAKIKRRPKIKNRLLHETLKLGYTQRPWEDTDHLVKRISKDNRSVVEGELLKAKFGASGRDINEIAKDYKLLDEKDARRKAQNKNRYENIKKINAKAEAEKIAKFEAKKRAKQIKRKTKNNIENEDGAMDIDEDEDEPMDIVENEQFNNKRLNIPTESSQNLKEIFNSKKYEKKNKNENVIIKPKRLGKNEKLNLKKKEIRRLEEQELLLNAREIIPFGETADAPPKFVGKFRDSINKSRAQAGKMDLLLKKLHPDLTDERQRVIDEYRRLKSNK